MPHQPSNPPRISRVTADPIKARHNAKTSRGLRVRDLYRGFMSKLDEGDIIAQAAALRCAELTVCAEDIRVRIKGGELALASELVGIENLVTRCVKELGRLPQEEGPTLAEYLAASRQEREDNAERSPAIDTPDEKTPTDEPLDGEETP
jgi:hypothetical protein